MRYSESLVLLRVQVMISEELFRTMQKAIVKCSSAGQRISL